MSTFRPLVLNALALRGVATLEAAILEEFTRVKYEPAWVKTRVAAGVETKGWRVYRLYPAGLTQREALYGRRTWESDADLMNYLSRNPCPKLELIFV
jgi:glycoprotein 3-alpha-L-fucosyltransferase